MNPPLCPAGRQGLPGRLLQAPDLHRDVEAGLTAHPLGPPVLWEDEGGCVTVGVSQWVCHSGSVTVGVSQWVCCSGCVSGCVAVGVSVDVSVGVSQWVCHSGYVAVGVSQ